DKLTVGTAGVEQVVEQGAIGYAAIVEAIAGADCRHAGTPRIPRDANTRADVVLVARMVADIRSLCQCRASAWAGVNGAESAGRGQVGRKSSGRRDQV